MPIVPSSQEKAILTGLVESQMADSISLFRELVWAVIINLPFWLDLASKSFSFLSKPAENKTDSSAGFHFAD